MSNISSTAETYDVAVIGGGSGGLAMAKVFWTDFGLSLLSIVYFRIQRKIAFSYIIIYYIL
jgi:hypothetical protein